MDKYDKILHGLCNSSWQRLLGMSMMGLWKINPLQSITLIMIRRPKNSVWNLCHDISISYGNVV